MYLRGNGVIYDVVSNDDGFYEFNNILPGLYILGAKAPGHIPREFIDSENYDIFICDVQMGNERGTDLLLEKGESLSSSQTQIVAISAYGQYRDLTKGVGVDYFLEKPISIGTLLTLICRLLDQ